MFSIQSFCGKISCSSKNTSLLLGTLTHKTRTHRQTDITRLLLDHGMHKWQQQQQKKELTHSSVIQDSLRSHHYAFITKEEIAGEGAPTSHSLTHVRTLFGGRRVVRAVLEHATCYFSSSKLSWSYAQRSEAGRATGEKEQLLSEEQDSEKKKKKMKERDSGRVDGDPYVESIFLTRRGMHVVWDLGNNLFG